MMLTEATILDALRDCYDPELRLNIVDLGLVRAVALAQDHDAPGAGIAGVPTRFLATITLLASGNSEAQAQLAAQIQNRLAGIEAISASTVHFAAGPLWTPASITPQGRRLLNMDKLDQPAFPILNNRTR